MVREVIIEMVKVQSSLAKRLSFLTLPKASGLAVFWAGKREFEPTLYGLMRPNFLLREQHFFADRRWTVVAMVRGDCFCAGFQHNLESCKPRHWPCFPQTCRAKSSSLTDQQSGFLSLCAVNT